MSTVDIRVNILERTMEFISTTATAADKLKRLAKTLRKSTKTSLAAALDTIAKQHGYEHWKHVTVCSEQTARNPPSQVLPTSLKNLLDRAAAYGPASPETQTAFAQGFVFAMDIKDALELSKNAKFSTIAECDDGWHIAARDLWTRWSHDRDEEDGSTRFESQEPEELADGHIEEMQNYRFHRYVGTSAPATLEQAYKHVMELSFFPPTHIWLAGKFIDLGDVSEITVDARVVFSTRRT